MTIDEYIDDFITALMLERGLSDNTCISYSSDLHFFSTFLKSYALKSPAQINRTHIVEFIKLERAEGMASSTRARRIAAIRMWLAYLKDCKLIKENPANLLDHPKKERPLPRTLSEQEVFEMIEHVNGNDPRSLRDRAILEVLYGCGMRVSELCDFKLDDVIDDGELVRITGKGDKERIVPLGSVAGNALKNYLANSRNSFVQDKKQHLVFLTRLGKAFSRQGVFKLIRKRAADVGISAKRISPHVLRHCFASHMLSHGADIRVIQELLGHTDISTTQIYTHIDRGRFIEVHKLHPRH